MTSIIEFIAANETLIMGSLFMVIIILLIVVLITDVINRKHMKNNINMILNDDTVINANEGDYSNPEATNIDVITPSEQVEEIKYVEEDEELEKTKAQLELKNLKEELIKAELKEKQKEEELVLSEEKEENIKDQINKFEESQEEDAIISIDELNKISDKIYSDETYEEKYKDEGNEPISIQELETLYNSIDESDKPVNTVQEESSIDKKQSKFINSPIISPVYGIDNNDSLNTPVIENTADLEKLTEEIRKTNEFLITLKELRKNLE